MISYSRDPHQFIPPSSVKIVGLGGAGANMLERIALDGMEGAELLALNTDVRTLGASMAGEKIQLGLNLTKGLGCGGDPELGHQAVLEAEDAIRAALKGRRIVFLCTGLGGGTGSGASPIVTRIAREEGAFVVVFATMPFAFEGKRRRDQAETALNELAVLSNALVTFDNNRMGELVLAKQGIHEAFVAADRMISESIKAVIRLVVRPGLINVGLDDLMSALRTTRSRCLFGSGLADGKDRAAKALRNALASPLLDQGTLLREARTVLVHLCGGEDLTLFEIELLMQRLRKFVPEEAHVLFGAAVDPAMGDSLSLTLISALPEDSLAMAPRDSLSRASDEEPPLLEPSQGFTPPVAATATAVATAAAFEPDLPAAVESTTEAPPASAPPSNGSTPPPPPPPPPVSRLRRAVSVTTTPSLFDEERPFAEPDPELDRGLDATPPDLAVAAAADDGNSPVAVAEFVSVIPGPTDDADDSDGAADMVEEQAVQEPEAPPVYRSGEPDPLPIEEQEDLDAPDLESSGFSPIPRKRPPGVAPWTTGKGPKNVTIGVQTTPHPPAPAAPRPAEEPEAPKLKLGVKTAAPQSELSLDSAPRGRFEGESPNVFEGEDLDLPPFLRKRK